MNDCAMCLLRGQGPRWKALIGRGSAVMFQHIRGQCIENGMDFPSKTCRRRDQITGERGNESGRMGNCVAKSPSLSDQGGFGSFTRPSRPSLPAEQVLVGLARSLRLRNLTPAESSVQLAARLGSKALGHLGKAPRSASPLMCHRSIKAGKK